MRGQKLLESRNIRTAITRNQEAMKKYGCGYGLQVKSAQLHEAVKILNENRIKISTII